MKEVLRPKDIIPAKSKRISTDALPMPQETRLQGKALGALAPSSRGITIGSNFQHCIRGEIVGIGTLAFFATLNGITTSENVVLVSNNHVLINNHAQVGSTVYQPSLKAQFDGSNVIDQDNLNAIGTIHDAGLNGNYAYQYPGESPINYGVDCASAKLSLGMSSEYRYNYSDSLERQLHELIVNSSSLISDIDLVSPSDLTSGSPYLVYKVGSATNRTVGKVTRVDTPFQIGTTFYDNVIEIEAIQNNCNGILQFAAEGDSGSPLMNEQGKLIGIIFAKRQSNPPQPDDEKFAYACHIYPVLDRLKITAITVANPLIA